MKTRLASSRTIGEAVLNVPSLPIVSIAMSCLGAIIDGSLVSQPRLDHERDHEPSIDNLKSLGAAV